VYPSVAHAPSLFGRTRTLWSQVVHRGLNTYGRDVMYLRAGLGVVKVWRVWQPAQPT